MIIDSIQEEGSEAEHLEMAELDGAILQYKTS